MAGVYTYVSTHEQGLCPCVTDSLVTCFKGENVSITAILPQPLQRPLVLSDAIVALSPEYQVCVSYFKISHSTRSSRFINVLCLEHAQWQFRCLWHTSSHRWWTPTVDTTERRNRTGSNQWDSTHHPQQMHIFFSCVRLTITQYSETCACFVLCICTFAFFLGATDSSTGKIRIPNIRCTPIYPRTHPLSLLPRNWLKMYQCTTYSTQITSQVRSD